jgi:hypothetical protein
VNTLVTFFAVGDIQNSASLTALYVIGGMLSRAADLY